MTYYDAINLLKKLENCSRDDDTLNQVYNNKIDLYDEMKVRYSTHVVATMSVRLYGAYTAFVNNINNNNLSLDAFSLELINLKKEINFSHKIINIPNIPEENKIELLDIFNDINDNATKDIETIIQKLYGEEYFNEYININILNLEEK